MGNKKRFLIMCSIFLLFISNVQISAKEENSNDEIINENNYVPIEQSHISNMENAAMGNGEAVFSARSLSHRWVNNNGAKSFYDAEGTLIFGKGSKYVIDVSEHNGLIDWEEVKKAGVDGAIIRVGYGYLEEDDYFKRNVAECNRLGIPYGIYLYSYAYDANFAYAEASGTAEMLARAKVSLSYPIYYDIENFTPWDYEGATRKPPQTAGEYRKVIMTYINRMNELGYKQVHVYSYRSYLQSKLNDPEILSHVSWVAAYTDTLEFTNPYYHGEQGWQYTSSGTVDGISGRVDLNCFSNQFIKPTAKDIILSDENRTMSVGSVYQFKATLTPANANSTISWRVGNNSIASVDQKGKITAKEEGTTWLYAITNNGLEAKALIKVIPAAEAVSIDESVKEIHLNENGQLKATVYPANASQAVTWRTGNSDVATVDKNGEVTAVSNGNTWLYARTWNGKEAKCLIKVTNPAKAISLNMSSRTMSVGSKYQFKPEITPENTTSTLTWRTGNSKVAAVDENGKVTALAVGNTWLYVKTNNGLEAKTLIKVIPAAEAVSINGSVKEIHLNESDQLKSTVYPVSASQAVTWRTGNSKVATVDANGEVTAVAVGNTWLYAKTWNGKEAKCLIKVTNPAKAISLNMSSRNMSVGSRYQFKPEITPNNTTSTLTWRTGNSKVATVDQNGIVTAVAVGNTWLYVKTNNGLEAKALIKVIPAAIGVTISDRSKEIRLRESVQLTATVYPANASQAVTWRSANTKVATVDQNGKVTATGVGSTVIYAETWNKKAVVCIINVYG